jgi:hypothetical protein
MVYESSIISKKDDWPPWIFCPNCHYGICIDNEEFTISYLRHTPICDEPLFH